MTKDELVFFLKGHDDDNLRARAAAVRDETIGSKVYLRGLIELSNRCSKDCYYCGIRNSNSKIDRYQLTKEKVLDSVKYALEQNYGSIVIQSGEQRSAYFTEFITELLIEIKGISNCKLGITISLGEQNSETYLKWFNAGAHRYLLRVESSNRELYSRIHPANHSFSERLNCLQMLQSIGYQVGSGVMIGLPFQTLDDLANDLLFLKNANINMCGMGPYIEHPDAMLGNSQYSLEERFKLSLRMISLLRLLMPDINIASTTALHAIHPQGREMGISAGANIIMPNITPQIYRGNYKLYNNKPLADIDLSGFDVAYGEWGDSRHFFKSKLL